jgi:hypothetical protein
MSDWRSWGVPEWNVRLLAHFFARRSENDGPVTTLLATQEEIARATGDAAASPDEVHDTFIAATLRTVRRASLLDTAADYLGYPAPPLDDQIPPFVSCLIFTCIAAAESSEDLASEGSFVARLRRLTNDCLPDPSLQILPRLWENLAAWLAEPTNTTRYRRLRLPDRGGLTRIGYTTKLAFPDRRDQKELSELLDAEGLLGHEPPVGKIVSLVARERSRFRRPFLDAMDEFRQHLSASATASGSSRLLDHRFWSAVREAAIRGRGRTETLELRYRVQLLADLQDDQLSLIAVSDDAAAADDVVASIELPVAYGPWRYAVVEKSDAGALDGGAIDRVVLSLLRFAHHVAPLSGYIEQGILPFLETNHGLLELAPMNRIGAAQLALVKEGLDDDLVALFGANTTRVATCRYDGWVQVERPNLATLASERLESTSLRRAWMLHRSVTRVGVSLSGGIPTDDGWLGLSEVLPRVEAPGATAITARCSDRDVPLRADDGSWRFPRQDFVGTCELRVTSSDDDTAARFVHFSLSPTHEEYKEPADPTAWIVEGVGATSATTRTTPFLAGSPVDDARGFADSTIYLGRELGQFVPDETNAAWSISEFGGVRVGRRVRADLAVAPTAQSASPAARRYWRKLLLQSAADPADAQFGDARHAVRQHVQRGGLTEVDFGAFEVTEHVKAADSHRSLERLVGAVAARANSRCGMSWSEWSLVVQQLMGLDPHHVGAVTRAWQEVGAIDVLAASRWRHRCVFARRPSLVTYRCGDEIGATLVGLALVSTRLRLADVARRGGIPFEERGSVSPFVPKTVVLRASRMDQLEQLARAVGIGVSTIDLATDRFRGACTHDPFSPAPVAYHWSNRWQTWSLTEPETPPGPEVIHWLRDDRPGYWRVSHDDKTIWSYDLNTARWWAARLAGRNALKTVSSHQLEAHHAYLPLPIARVVSVFARTNHGPEPAQSWRYRYPLVTTRLRDEIFAALQAAFDLQHLQGA